MSEWISVDDRLPEQERTVMLMISGALGYGEYHGQFDNVVYFDWDIIKGRCQAHPARVTHWQPLPPPPVTDEERSAALAELLSGKFADDA